MGYQIFRKIRLIGFHQRYKTFEKTYMIHTWKACDVIICECCN
jgi:hypothetical protein